MTKPTRPYGIFVADERPDLAVFEELPLPPLSKLDQMIKAWAISAAQDAYAKQGASFAASSLQNYDLSSPPAFTPLFRMPRPTSTPDAVQQLIHLRAVMVRMSTEMAGAADKVTGKGAPRARVIVKRLAKQMRDAAMAHDVKEACER